MVEASVVTRRQPGSSRWTWGLIGMLALTAVVGWFAVVRGQPREAEPKPVTVIRGYAAGASYEQTADELRKAFPGVAIVVDARTRQVIVNTTPDIQDQIAQWLERKPPVQFTPRDKELKPEPLAVALKNISAVELENVLVRTWGRRITGTLSPDGQTSTVQFPGRNGAGAVAEIDRQTGQVRITGNETARRAVAALLKAVDRSDRDPTDAQVIPLAKADPAQLRTTLSLISVPGADGRTEIRAPGKSAADSLLTRLFQKESNDEQQPAQPPAQQPNPPQPPADPQPNPPPNGDPRQPGPPRFQGLANDDEGGLIGNVQIEFLDGLDVIIVRGKKRDVERVTKIIEEIERLSEETRPAIQVYALRHVNNEAISTLLIQVYDQILSSRQGRVSITPLVKPNALLLIGRQENINLVVELIQKLDQPTIPQAQTKVFRLVHMSALEAEQTVRNFFGQRVGAGGGQQPGGQQFGGQQFGGQQGLGQVLGQALGQGGAFGGAAQQGGLGTRVIVVSDFRSNSLIVQASPRDLHEVATLLKQLDVENSKATNEIRIFKLHNTLAQELAPVLQSAIRGSGTTGGTGQVGQQVQQFLQGQGGQGGQTAGGTTGQSNRSTGLQFMAIDADGKRTMQSGIMADVVVSADIPANALVVRGPSRTMDLIAALVRELDSLPAAEAQLKVFTIINGDATVMAQTMQQLFGQAVTIGRGQGGLFGAGANTAAFTQLGQFGQQQQGGPNAGDSTLVPLRFAVDVRTNSILSSGSAGDLKVVEAILLRLDEGDVPTRKMTVYRLKNAFAEDVANSITTFLQSQRQIIQQNLVFNQAIGPFEQLEREVVVVAEPQSNSVIVSATPKFDKVIMDVIRQLDFRPPMVMVQVLIGEVQLTDLYEFGVELGLQDSLLFDRGKAALANNANPPGFPIAVPGFNYNNQPLANLNSFSQEKLAGQSLSTFGLGRVNPTLGYGGMVLSAASESINILIRALQDSGKLQVLSRPQVMAIHNRQARVLVGQKVPRITGSTTNQQGNVQNSVVDVDVGLILNIIPQINEDGIVIMNIQAERSALGPENQGVQIATTPQGAPIRQPLINNTSAVTTISAKDNQTVLFAGLITSEKEVAVRRIPYLADIPYLGELFQFKSNTNRRRELLIVMTPHIIKDDVDYDWLSAVESERMSWCIGDAVALHGDVGLRSGSNIFCDPRVPVIYPDEDPSGHGLRKYMPWHAAPQPAVMPVMSTPMMAPSPVMTQPVQPQPQPLEQPLSPQIPTMNPRRMNAQPPLPVPPPPAPLQPRPGPALQPPDQSQAPPIFRPVAPATYLVPQSEPPSFRLPPVTP